ncbi:MAG: hypothetical protein IPJ65_13650 [Archangiaceae bacterium]|nr:hypothetical protein [Archangiaceae bacterium]
MTDDVQVGLFGGRHGDVGSWRRLLELASELTRPAFVAVEWSEALYAAVVALQPEVAEALQTRWPFLSASDGADLAAALAWEVNVPMRIWPGIEIVWLENGFQEADLQRRHGVDAATFARSHAEGLVERLSDPCAPSISEFMAGSTPPREPTSSHALIDRDWRKCWSYPSDDESNPERDERWAKLLAPRISSLSTGWAAVTVGWVHADPARPRRLCALLADQGFRTRGLSLGP